MTRSVLRDVRTMAAVVAPLLALVLVAGVGRQMSTEASAASLNNTVVYWLNGGNSTIKKVTSAGTGIATVPGVTANYRSLATDGTYLYYSESPSGIKRVPLAGGTSTVVSSTASVAGGMHVDATHIYWPDWNNGIYRTNKDGSGSSQHLVTDAAKSIAEQGTFASNSFSGVTANSTHLYFITYGNGGTGQTSVFRANLDGSSVTRLYSAEQNSRAIHSQDVAVSSTKIYIGAVSTNGMISMNLDGTGASSFFRVGKYHRSIEIAGDYMYVGNGYATISRFPLADPSAAETVLADNPNVWATLWDIALVDAPTVTYVGGGHTAGAAPVDSSSPYSVGDTVTVLGNTGSLEKSGHEFNGWTLTQGASTTTVAPAGSFVVTTDAILTARWIAGPLEFAATAPGASSSTFAFPSTTFGSSSEITVHVRNMGGVARSVDSVALQSQQGVTRTGGTCSTGGSPDISPYSQGGSPDNSCTHVFTWSPTSASQSLNATFTVTSGIVATTVTLTGTAVATGRTPTFDTPVPTADGFTVNVTNWDAAWTWTPTITTGTVVLGTGSGTTIPVTVSGLSPGAQASLTVAVTRVGYADGSDSVSGSAAPAATTTTPATTVAPATPSPETTAPATPTTPGVPSVAAAERLPAAGGRTGLGGLAVLMCLVGVSARGSAAVRRRVRA